MTLNIEFPVATSNWGTISHVKLYDSYGHELMYFDTVSSVQTNAGDTLNIAADLGDFGSLGSGTSSNNYDLKLDYHDMKSDAMMTSSVTFWPNSYSSSNKKENDMLDRSLNDCHLCGDKVIKRTTVDIKTKKDWKQITTKTFKCGTKITIDEDGRGRVVVGKKCLRFK